MACTGRKFVGIEPFGKQQPFTYAILDENCDLENLDFGEAEDIIFLMSKYDQVIVAINGPRNTNHGIVMQENLEKGLTSGQRRGGDVRVCEKILRDVGINISTTPSRIELCPEWMRSTFQVYKDLERIGFSLYRKEHHEKLLLESNPYAVFCALLEQKPLNKATLEGRLQRQLLLFEEHVGIKNPMNFFEEITSFKLLKGILPMEDIYTPEQLDAIAAAYTAFIAHSQPENVTLLGSGEEGFIVLPVNSLKVDYS